MVRAALRGEPVRFQGQSLRLPLSDRAGAALVLTTEPLRRDLPIYLAAVGPASLELAGEVADGWVGVFASPAQVGHCVDRLRAGREKAGRTLAGFEVIPGVPTVIGADVAACADQVRGYFAHFLGMGSRDRNIYLRHAEALGHGAAAALAHKK